MGYGTQHPHSEKEHIELYNILKFGVNQANIRRDIAIQNLNKCMERRTNRPSRPAFPEFSFFNKTSYIKLGWKWEFKINRPARG